MSLLNFMKNRKDEEAGKQNEEALNETTEVQENNPSENPENLPETPSQTEEELEQDNIPAEKTLLVIQWDGLNRATSEFEFLDNFKGANVWIFSKQPLESIPEKFQDFNVKLFPMPEEERSLQNFLLSTTLFTLFVDNPGIFEKVVFVSAHPYFEGIAYVFSQRGIASEAIVYNLPDKRDGRKRQRMSRRRFGRGRGKGSRRSRGRIRYPEAERIVDLMERTFKDGEIYSIKDLASIVNRATKKRYIELFGVSSIGPFIRMLIDNNCIEEVGEKNFRFIEVPTLRMVLDTPKYRRRKRSAEQETASENLQAPTNETEENSRENLQENPPQEEQQELNIMTDIQNLGNE